MSDTGREAAYTSDTRRCNHCGEVKSVTEFSVDRRRKRGYQYKCKACSREYHIQHRDKILTRKAKYYQEHREESKAYYDAYAEKYPDKIKLYKKTYKISERGRAAGAAYKHRRRATAGSYLSTDTVEELKAEYGGYCPYCNQKIDDGHIDHIVPIASGGTNDRNNLVYVCSTCNYEKWTRSLLEFMIYRAMAA